MNAWEPARFAHRRFERVADLVARFTHAPDWPSVAALNECFGPELRRAGVRLVEAPKAKPARSPDGTIDPASLYEIRIVEYGEIPTRPRNAHDLLNALVWAAFPHAKLALTRALATLQRERAAGRATLPATRTPLHDRLAMLDEGAVLCVGETPPWIFGHAIYEHAYAGIFDVRGLAVDLVVPGVAALDPIAARARIDGALATAELATAARPGPGIPID
jgi:hypothetical protein